jgi:hypothetical protein
MSVNPSKAQALRAKESGSSSLYGTAWRNVKTVLNLIKSWKWFDQ